MALSIPARGQGRYLCDRPLLRQSAPRAGLAGASTAKRNEAAALVKQGLNPTTHRDTQIQITHAENANTFEAIAKEWIGRKRAKWTPYYLKQAETFMAADVYPKIGAMPIKFVTATHTPIARGDFKDLLRKIDTGTYRATAITMRLLLLTWVRPVELRAATWPEFDLERAEWRVPAERMKLREEHIVPLSCQAVALLAELKTITGGSVFLFPNVRGPNAYMTATTMNRALERMGYGGKYSSHGFRTTASTILNELGYNPDWVERELAHKPRNQSRAAYNDALYLEQRAGMMQEYADLSTLGAGARAATRWCQ